MFNNIGSSLQGSFQDVWGGVAAHAPSIIVAIVLFIIGWIIAALVGRLIAQIIRAIKLDNLLDQAGFGMVLKRAGMGLNSGAFLGGLVEWFIIVIFLVAALQVVGLNQVGGLLYSVVGTYLPRVIGAVITLLIAVVIADALSKIVASSTKATGIRAANMLGAITRWSISIFGFLAALYQLGIADQLIQTLFTGLVVALSLAFGLAFGLGGQEAASRWIEKTREEIKSHHE